MPQTTALRAIPGGVQTLPDRRTCVCGCGRDISRKRAGAVCFDASCRQRLRRDKARRELLTQRGCQCGPRRLTEVDVDGDLCCVQCGSFIRHVRAPLSGFDTAAWEMVTDAEGRLISPPPRRRRHPASWRLELAA